MTAAWHLQPLTDTEADELARLAAPVEAHARVSGHRLSHSKVAVQQAMGPFTTAGGTAWELSPIKDAYNEVRNS